MEKTDIAGPFSSQENAFSTLESFVQHLLAAGFEGNVEWRSGKKLVPAEQAQMLEISVAGNVVFRHTGRGGFLNAGVLSVDQQKILLDQLDRAGLIVEPGSGLPIGLGVLYCALHLFLISSRFGEANAFGTDGVDGLLAILPAIGFLCAVIGTLIMLFRSKPVAIGREMILPGIFLLPGFILTVPSALLLIPAINYGGKKAVFDAFRELRSRNASAREVVLES